MARKEKKLIQRRITNAYLSSVISISLVLLLVGAACLLLVNAESVSDFFKENFKVSLIIKSDVPEEKAILLGDELKKKSYIKETEYISREQGHKEMADLLGEDFLEVFETSPVPVSYNVRLQADYVTADSLEMLAKDLSAFDIVEEVVYQHSLVEKLNANLKRISAIFAVFIVLLLFISFVLINNVMRLSVYDKRFIIHTMRLVGATKGFIRRPFLKKAALLALISALLSILMLLFLLYFVKSEFVQLFEVFRQDLLFIVLGIVVGSGLLICVVSTYFVVGKLVGMSNDELYS